MIDFGLGKLLLWSAATACAGIFITQAADVHPATFTLNDVMQAPDGKRLAFVSHRSSHSLIGVYDFVRPTIVRLSPSLDYDSSWP